MLRALAIALIFFVGVTPAPAEDGRTPLPQPHPAYKGEQCVEPVDVMRRWHMTFLLHQRDDTVRGGIRGQKYSLRGCVDCHATPNEAGGGGRSVQGFCDACHDYAAVRISCFECHSDRAEATE